MVWFYISKISKAEIVNNLYVQDSWQNQLYQLFDQGCNFVDDTSPNTQVSQTSADKYLLTVSLEKALSRASILTHCDCISLKRSYFICEKEFRLALKNDLIVLGIYQQELPSMLGKQRNLRIQSKDGSCDLRGSINKMNQYKQQIIRWINYFKKLLFSNHEKSDKYSCRRTMLRKIQRILDDHKPFIGFIMALSFKRQFLSNYSIIFIYQFKQQQNYLSRLFIQIQIQMINKLTSANIFQKLSNTPQKRVKPNEESTIDQSKKCKALKSSLINKLNDSQKSTRKEHLMIPAFEISQFEIPNEYHQSSNMISDKIFEKMDEEESYSEITKIQLGRKLTIMQQEYNEQFENPLNLYRSNSSYEQSRTVQDLKLGDNIYLKKLNSVDKPPQNLKKMHNDQHHSSRIQQDYQIEENLKIHNKHHQNYICLNKLERIFYYVKKISMDWNSNSNYQFLQKLASCQIKVLNKDQKGYFLRYYQSWLQHNALYLTFQVAVQSLQDCLTTHKRLREVQAWDLIRDCSHALSWMASYQGSSHLNIKPGNILKCQRKFKLADPYTDPSILQAYLKLEQDNWGGWAYLAPQIKRFYSLIQGLDLKKCDIYSLGMSVIENLLGQKYFPREGKAMRLYIQKHLHGYSPFLVKTLMRMISLDPSKRPTSEQLCEIGKCNNNSIPVKKRRFSI